MSEFRIKVDLSDVMSVRGIITAQLFPQLRTAVSAVAQQTRIDWMDSVKDAKLWSGEKRAYMKSIQWRMVNDFEALVWSDYKLAEEIETGRPPRDLKKMLDTSLKVRISKKGKRYLYIPFRHNTPGSSATGQAMPVDVYALAKDLAPSSVVGRVRRVSGAGSMDVKTRKPVTVNQNKYAWGTSLPEGLKPKMKPHHATDIYAGMRKMDTSDGGGARSTYLTIRTMVQGSSKWIVPAKPGLYLAKGVAEKMQPAAEAAFRQAMRKSV